MKKVVDVRLRAGGSILQPSFKHHWWELTLECGHVVERRIRYLPPKNGRPAPRGYAAQWHAPSMSRIPEEGPKRAKCDVCER